MSGREDIWSFGLIGGLLAAFILFKRIRRRTADFHESAGFKARLPGWIRQVEAALLCAFVGAGAAGITLLFHSATGLLPFDPQASTGVAALYFSVGLVLISLPAAALAANLVSWLIPPVRSANERAMAGSKVSFSSTNRGLLYFAAVSVPLGLLILWTAAWAPWSR